MKTWFYEIEPYQIQAPGLDLTVIPLPDGTYRVNCGEKYIADLYPEITAAGIYWNGFGLISPGVADQIGTQISACESEHYLQ